MNKSLSAYNPTSNMTLILGLAMVALVIWFIAKNKTLGYNAETVTIQRDERGRISGMTVQRSAH